MERVRASIVIPVYGGVDLTRQCVESLVAAGLDSRDELIVVDNASPDATPAYLATLSDTVPIPVTVITNAENRNFAGACNQGAEAARGEYILFLNNDTVVSGDWLGTLIAEAESSGADIVGARLHYGDGRIQHAGVVVERGCFPRHLHRLAAGTLPLARESYDCQIVTGACMLVDRSTFLELGGFDEAFVNGCEDIDFCWRAREAGLRVRYCGGTDILHLESQSEGRNLRDDANVRMLNERWAERINADAVSGDRILRVADSELPWKLETPRKVTVVIPVFNNLADTRSCIDSIFAAGDGDELEVIVVDNASSDGTQAYLDSLAGRVRSIHNDRNYDFAGGCNQGAAHATGRFIVFLNNDTVVRPGWWQALVAPLEDDPKVGVVGGRLLYPDGTVQHAGVAFGDDRIGYHVHAGVPADDPRVSHRRPVQAVTGACLTMRRKDVITLQGFDQGYRNGCEDLDLCLRVQQQLGMSIVYEPACTIVHAESKSVGRFEHALANLARYLQRWATTVVPDEQSFGVEPKTSPFTRQPGSETIVPDANAELTMAGRINHALSLVTHELVTVDVNGTPIELPRELFERVGGLDPEITDIAVAWEQFAVRARMAGYDLPFDNGADTTVRLNARTGVFLPLMPMTAHAADVAFDGRASSILVCFDHEDVDGSTETIEQVFATVSNSDDITVVVRTGADPDAAYDVLERIADHCVDVPDIVVIESDARADRSLAAAVELVVCGGRRGWALAGIARDAGTTPIRVEDLDAAMKLLRQPRAAA